MNNTTNLQVPLDKTLKENATAVAKDYGFSSLQEVVRVLLTKLAKNELNVSIEEQFPPVQLSPKAAKRYDKMAEEIESGKLPIYEAKNIKDLLDQLYGRKNPIHSKIPKKL